MHSIFRFTGHRVFPGKSIDDRQFQPTPNANSLDCLMFVSLPISDAITAELAEYDCDVPLRL